MNGCGHLRKDHEKPGPKPPHVHFRTPAGDKSARMFPTSNRGAYCKVALCSCLDYQGAGAICGGSQ
jgi:hypothetical protein